MKYRKIWAIILLVIIVVTGCKHNKVNDNGLTSENEVDFIDTEKNFDSILISLPKGWKVSKDYSNLFSIIDENEVDKGDIWVMEYIEDFDLMTQHPNHSVVTNDEEIDLSLGKGRLLTLDSDNGTAASGITGTHDVYYASILVAGKEIYILSFNNNDKDEKSKSLFMSILKSIKLK